MSAAKPNGNEDQLLFSARCGTVDDFIVVHQWQWRELLQVAPSSLQYGQLVMSGLSPLRVFSTEASPDEGTCARLAHVNGMLGDASKLRYQFLQFNVLFCKLYYGCNLDVDGKVDFSRCSPVVCAAEVNALFNSFLMYGKRILDFMDYSLKLYYPDEHEYNYWRLQSRKLYDNSLDYAFCYDFRNVVEHEGIGISIVNIDERTCQMGIALIIDAEVMSSNIKVQLKRRLAAFARRANSNNCVPWLSVGKTCRSYYCAISVLAALYSRIIVDRLKETKPEYCSYCLGVPKPANCIIRDMQEEHGYKPAARVYEIESCDSYSYILDWAEKIESQAWEMLSLERGSSET